MDFPGVIGTGKQALNWYLKTIQSIGEKHFGAGFVIPLKVLGVPFTPINNILPHRMKEAGKMMIPYFKEMEKISHAPYILANITLHEAMDQNKNTIEPSPNFIHISTVLKEQKSIEGQEVIIIGSLYSMRQTYISGLISKHFNHVSISNLDDYMMGELDSLRKTYYLSPDAQKAKQVFNKLIETYPNTIFIIACTEHALALEEIDNQDKFINLPLEQCKALISRTSIDYK